MSTLSDNLKELQEPSRKPSNFKIWLDSLTPDDRTVAIEALKDPGLKNYPLFQAFRNSGMKVSKDYFIKMRNEIISGSLKVEEIR